MAEEVEWVADATAFETMASEWEALVGEEGHPYDLPCWLRAWWEAFGDGSRLAICTVRRDGGLVGVYPLRRDGRRLVSLTTNHTFTARPLARDARAMNTLVPAVVGDGRTAIEVTGMPREDDGTLATVRIAREARMLPNVEATFASPYVATEGDYEVWRKENKHRWKAPLERKWRKTERDYDARFSLVEAPTDLDAELKEGLRIEASGWKGEAGTAMHSAADSALFYGRLAHAFAARDALRFSWIVLDGRAVSFDYCLLFRRRLYTLKSGFDEEFESLAPGLVLRLAVIKTCFESDIELHDLLGDEIGWKTRFSSGNRPHVVVRVFPGNSLGRLRLAYRESLRPRLKRTYGRLRLARR